jgi:hypothetical protein
MLFIKLKVIIFKDNIAHQNLLLFCNVKLIFYFYDIQLCNFFNIAQLS